MDGIPMFIRPVLSPTLISRPIETTASLGDRIWSNCGSVSRPSTEKAMLATLCQARLRSCRMMRNRVSRMLCSISVVSRVSARAFSAAAEQHLEKREYQRRIQLHHRVPVKRLHAESDQNGGRRQALRELGEGELFDRDQVHDHISAQVTGKAGSQIAGEVVVQQVDRPELVLGDPVRAAEIVDGGLSWRSFLVLFVGLLKYLVDLVLREQTAHDGGIGGGGGSIRALVQAIAF